MDCARLDELIKIPKKSDASNAVKDEFNKEVTALLVEEGVSNKTMKYVYSGFSFCGAVPLYKYLSQCGENTMLENLKSAFEYESLSKNENGIALRMALHMLCFEFSHSTYINETLEFLIALFNSNSKSKESGFRKDLSKVVEKYFVNCIHSESELSNFKACDINDACFVEFKSILIYALNGIKPLKAKTTKSLGIIKQWIGYTPEITKDSLETAKPDESGSSRESENAISESDMIQTIEYLISSMPEYQSVLSQLLLRYRKLIENKDIADDLRNKLERAYEKMERIKNELRITTERVESLTSQKHSLIFQISELEKQIESLNADNEKLKKIISVYSVDKTDSQNEQLNAIASRLKPEYKDFKEAEDMEMTIDLGENLRVQMKSVFKILSKSGIDVEGR